MTVGFFEADHPYDGQPGSSEPVEIPGSRFQLSGEEAVDA